MSEQVLSIFNMLQVECYNNFIHIQSQIVFRKAKHILNTQNEFHPPSFLIILEISKKRQQYTHAGCSGA